MSPLPPSKPSPPGGAKRQTQWYVVGAVVSIAMTLLVVAIALVFHAYTPDSLPW